MTSIRRVLYAEDTPQVCALVTRLIRCMGDHIHVETVTNGCDLIQRARDNLGSYALILTDNCMPHVSGTEAIRTIRNFDSQTPIYMITADGQEIHNLALQNGATGVIGKNYATLRCDLCDHLRQHLS